MPRPLAAAALLLAPAAAPAQGPIPGPYLAPNPYAVPPAYGPLGSYPAWGAPPALGGPPVFGPDAYPFNPPAYARHGRYATPPRSRFGPAFGPTYGAPALPRIAGAFTPAPSQSVIYQPNPYAPPLRLEPVAEEATVGQVRARRYDFSFDAVPLTPDAPAPARVW